MNTNKRVFVKSDKPLLDFEKVKRNCWQILETHKDGFVVEASQFQIEMLKAEGFEVLEEINE